MTYSRTRGGPKPQMLAVVQEEISIDYYGKAKLGMYEMGNGVLARRVELPEWACKGGKSHQPTLKEKDAPKESQGHIFFNPPESLFQGPAVGLDLKVFERLRADPSIRRVSFYVYATGYQLREVWSITRDSFLAAAKRVQTSTSFMPQMMVPITALQ